MHPPSSATSSSTGPRPEPMDVAVREEGIRLGQFLKLAGLADSGSHARSLLDDDLVSVNDEAEQRRGRQLVRGDVVTVGTERARVC